MRILTYFMSMQQVNAVRENGPDYGSDYGYKVQVWSQLAQGCLRKKEVGEKWVRYTIQRFMIVMGVLMRSLYVRT